MGITEQEPQMTKAVTLLLSLGMIMGLVTATPAQVLIYTKNGEGYVHDNIAKSVETLQKICAEHDLGAEVSDDPAVFSDDNLKQYRTIVFSNTNNEAFDTEEQKQAFVRYVRSGGGFMGIHSACGSEREWPWFNALVGGLFMRHPKLQSFDIKVIDADHPATYFLPDPWPWEDECYYIHHLNPDIHVLLAADLSTIEDDKRDVYPGKTWGDLIPIAWCHRFDGGRQFYTALGHKIEYYDDPLFVRHLEAGLLWSMKK